MLNVIFQDFAHITRDYDVKNYYSRIFEQEYSFDREKHVSENITN